MQLSSNYQLKLPEGTDNVKRQDFVDNFSKIDSVMKEHDTSLSENTQDIADLSKRGYSILNVSHDLSIAGQQTIQLPTGTKKLEVFYTCQNVGPKFGFSTSNLEIGANASDGYFCSYNIFSSLSFQISNQLIRVYNDATNNTYAYISSVDAINNVITLTWIKEGTGATGGLNIKIKCIIE